MMDANANRAREGLRVLEDIARFVLDRGDLSATAKQIRHDLAQAVAQASGGAVARLASRDVEGDVGTSISTPSEARRGGWRDLALAAAGRATEALRVLEESAKMLGRTEAALTLERCRYRAYTLERDLVLSLPKGLAKQWRLCVLLTESLCTHHDWKAVASMAIAGGADCIQLREKSLPDAELLNRARFLVEMCRNASPCVALIVNDRPDIAMLSGADGVHLGQGDLPVRDARVLLGPNAIIGVSTSNLDEAKAARGHGADYIGVGPMFPTSTKLKESIVGPAYLAAVLADPTLAQKRHLAIGGITYERVSQMPGVRGIAVSSAVCSASDPRDACQRLIRALESLG
jgi:thiamine-phosphate pyrophosphorylase